MPENEVRTTVVTPDGVYLNFEHVFDEEPEQSMLAIEVNNAYGQKRITLDLTKENLITLKQVIEEELEEYDA